MAVNSKGSRKIVVDDHEFRWRVTGNDGDISVAIWPVKNDCSRIIGVAGYHNEWIKEDENSYTSKSQAVITNRVIKEIILHIGTEKILEGTGQLDIGAIETIYDFGKAIRN